MKVATLLPEEERVQRVKQLLNRHDKLTMIRSKIGCGPFIGFWDNEKLIKTHILQAQIEGELKGISLWG